MAEKSFANVGGAIPENGRRAWLSAQSGAIKLARRQPQHAICERSVVLMQKKLLLSLPEHVEAAKVERGIILLNEASVGQMRKNGYESEAVHPTEMAILATQYNGKLFRINPKFAAEVINLILLHDVLENNRTVDARHIATHLSCARTAEMVEMLTMREEKTHDGYRRFKRRIHTYGDTHAIIARALDREQQARSLAHFSTPQLVESFTQKSIIHLEEMEGALSRRDIDAAAVGNMFSHLSILLIGFGIRHELGNFVNKVEEIRKEARVA